MPVFEATDSANPPIRMDGWDDDELIYLRPHVTYLLEQRAKGKALLLPEDLSGEQLRAMPQDEVERLMVKCTDQSRIDEQLLLDMIERWTLRRQPSTAQREKGERGDLVPLSREAIAQLPPGVGQWLRAEIEKRRDIVPAAALVGPEGDDFRLSTLVPDQGVLSGSGRPLSPDNGAGSGVDREGVVPARDRHVRARPA